MYLQSILTYLIATSLLLVCCKLSDGQLNSIQSELDGPKQRVNDKFIKFDTNNLPIYGDKQYAHIDTSSSFSMNRNKNQNSNAACSTQPSQKYIEHYCTEEASCATATERGIERSINSIHPTIGLLQSSYVNTNNIDDMVLIEEGIFEMGSNDSRYKADGEGPIRKVPVNAFYLDKYAVSNARYRNFIIESGYKTDAEKYGNSFVFDRLLSENLRNQYQDLRAVQAKWWIKLNDVTWDHPEGPDSTILDRLNHPAVHVSWHDAQAYCAFYHKRLPTEMEWEKACRGGLRQKLYPWGNAFNAKNMHRANIWHGHFPYKNTMEDGYLGTCPVDEFPPNNYDLFNMVGNIWEWTSTAASNYSKVDRIKKGGSFMCHESYCFRYRCAARSHNTDDSTASNLGFRCAKTL